MGLRFENNRLVPVATSEKNRVYRFISQIFPKMPVGWKKELTGEFHTAWPPKGALSYFVSSIRNGWEQRPEVRKTSLLLMNCQRGKN